VNAMIMRRAALAMVCGGFGVIVAAVTFMGTTILTAEMHLDLALALWEAEAAAAFAGGWVAYLIWRRVARAPRASGGAGAAAFGVGPLAAALFGAIHVALSANLLGVVHTWRTLYTLDCCAGGRNHCWSAVAGGVRRRRWNGRRQWVEADEAGLRMEPRR
jgi:hypothetical protein